MLSLTELDVFYSRHRQVLYGVSLELPLGTIVTVMGPNGAGKSTLVRTIMGLVHDQPSRGEIRFEGESLRRLRTAARVRRGLALVPEGRGIFQELNVHENLLMGGWVERRAAVREAVDRVYQRFPKLRERRAQRAGTLSGGEQQMLAIGRALMSKPKTLLLDEPTLGLAPQLVKEVHRILLELAEEGMGILLIEQSARLALEIASFGHVLEGGKIVLSGPAGELRANPQVQGMYLGP